MKIIHRYFLLQFLKPFLFGLISFVIIMTVSHLFENLDTFTGVKAHPFDIFRYLVYQIPLWTVQVLPVAVLLGSLFSLNKLLLSGEITAVKASGIHIHSVLMCILIAGVGISCGVFMITETIIPACTRKANSIYRVDIRRLPEEDNTRWDRIVISGKGDIRLTAEQLNLSQGYLKRVVIDQFEQNALTMQIDAREAFWNGTNWDFKYGVMRWFSDDGKYIIRETAFDNKAIDIHNSPEDLAPQRIKPEEMNFKKLRRYIKHLQKLGIPNTSERVQLQLKIAFPFANLIILLIGIPFALWSVKGSGKLVSFGIALAVAFSYWGMISIGQSLGNARILPPVLAAWFANIIFGTAGFILFKKIKS